MNRLTNAAKYAAIIMSLIVTVTMVSGCKKNNTDVSSELNKSDNDDDFTLYIYSIKDGDYYYMDSSNISDMTLISEIRKALDNPFDKTFDTDKVILSVSYYDEDTYNNVKYYMQLSDYSTLKSLGY